MSEISDRFDITAAAASQLVDKLVHNDLIQRTEDPNDRRAKQLALSNKGSEFIKKGIDERYRWMNNLEDTLSAEEQKKISEALTLLINAASKLDK